MIQSNPEGKPDKADFFFKVGCVGEYLSHCVLPQTICLEES